MRRLLTLCVLLAGIGAVRAGSPPIDDRDNVLLPGDFGKPVIVAPLPGIAADPWRIDDPDIIIDEDGPSEDDEGIIYLGGTALRLPRRFADDHRR